MRGTCAKLSLLFGILAGLPVAAVASDPSFNWVSPRPGHILSYATGVSDDGSTVSGWSAEDESLTRPVGYRWTAAGGRQEYGTLERPYGTAMGISGDGSTLTGFSSAPGAFNQQAFRQVGSGPAESLGVQSGYTNSVGVGASTDGNTIVGYSWRGPEASRVRQPFRWTATGGMQPLGFLQPDGYSAEPLDMSADGRTIVGSSFGESDPFAPHAFVWREGIGYVGLMVPGTDGGLVPAPRASAVGASGRWITGVTTIPGATVLIRWDNLEPEVIGAAPGYRSVRPRDITAQGSMIVGNVSNPTGGGPEQQAMIWSESFGFSPLREFLANSGVVFPPGTSLVDCFAISPDGQSFAGIGGDNGQLRGFVATIPSPYAGGALGMSALFFGIRRRRFGVQGLTCDV